MTRTSAATAAAAKPVLPGLHDWRIERLVSP
jgi:hypothetical protein